MTRFAQIAYDNASDQPTSITVYVNTCARLACGAWRVDAVDRFPGIASKPDALALIRSLGARIA